MINKYHLVLKTQSAYTMLAQKPFITLCVIFFTLHGIVLCSI